MLIHAKYSRPIGSDSFPVPSLTRGKAHTSGMECNTELLTGLERLADSHFCDDFTPNTGSLACDIATKITLWNTRVRTKTQSLHAIRDETAIADGSSIMKI